MKKKIAIIVVSIIAVVALVAGASYAYYSARVKENNKTETVIKTNELTLVYTGGQEINVTGIVPGDSFTKTFTVENTSTIAVDYNIYLQNITNEFNEDLVYTLSDETGSVVSETVLPETNTGKDYVMTNVSIASGVTKEYTLTVSYKYKEENQNAYQGKTFSATLGVDTLKVETPVASIWTLTTDENGNNKADIGDLITTGTESFYVISNDDTNIKALAQYNLYVGGTFDNSTSTYTPYGDEATDMQDSTMVGYVSGQDIYIYNGTTAFSSTSSEYAGSIVEGYVNTYKTKLEELGATINSASLITKEELETLGCSSGNNFCTSAPAFIYSTSYWSGSLNTTSTVWDVHSSGSFYRHTYYNTSYFGVRPVISISSSEI